MRAFDPKKVPKPPGLDEFNWSLTKGPIAIELGCGTGVHPIQFSKEHPNECMIAIEQTQNKFASFEKQLGEHPELNNLFAFRADAIWWCAHNLVPEVKLDKIFILYPNPNPKESQANKRFHNMPFMGFLLSHLRSGGTLTLATNIDEYAQEAKIKFVSNWDLKLASESELDSNHAPRTAFEKKYLDRGERCFNFIFEK